MFFVGFAFGNFDGTYKGQDKVMKEAVRRGYATMVLEKDDKVYYHWKESKPESN